MEWRSASRARRHRHRQRRAVPGQGSGGGGGRSSWPPDGDATGPVPSECSSGACMHHDESHGLAQCLGGLARSGASWRATGHDRRAELAVDGARILRPRFRAGRGRSDGKPVPLLVLPPAPPPAEPYRGARAMEDGEGVSGSHDHVSRLLRGLRLLGRRAVLLLDEGPPERSTAVPGLPGRGQACTNRRRSTGVPCGRLWRVRRPGGRAVRATQRSARLLQLVLRQGARRYDRRVRQRLTQGPRPTMVERLGPSFGRLRPAREVEA